MAKVRRQATREGYQQRDGIGRRDGGGDGKRSDRQPVIQVSVETVVDGIGRCIATP